MSYRAEHPKNSVLADHMIVRMERRLREISREARGFYDDPDGARVKESAVLAGHQRVEGAETAGLWENFEAMIGGVERVAE